MSNNFRSKLLLSSLLVSVASVAAPVAAQTAGTNPRSAVPDATQSTPTQAPPVAGSNSPEPGIQAQEAAPTAPTSQGDIVVTGSLIRNPNLVSVAPVAVVGANEIALRQQFNAEQIVRDIPGTVPSIGSQVNNGNGGASFVNLRGLGANRNIVLLDGNRIVPADLTGAVDLNNIPVALIERVDVLTGGASTTYGADAIAGVVNFITRSDFAGVDLQAQSGISERGDAAQKRVDLTIGGNFADDKGNAVLSLGYQLVDPLYQGDRSFSAVNVDSFDGSAGGSGTTVPSRFTLGAARRQINPATGALGPTFATYNFNPFNLFQTPINRKNIYGAAHYDLSDAVTFYSRGLFSKNAVSTVVAPSGVFASNIVFPYSNPYLPAAARAQFCGNATNNGGTALTTAQCNAAALATDPTDPNYRTFTTNVQRRTPEVGSRISTYTTTIYDIRAGLRGAVTPHLSYDIGGGYGESENIQTTSGYALLSRARQAALATNTTSCIDPTNGCVPVNFFGDNGSITPGQAAFLTQSSTISNRASLGQVRGQISGDFGFSSPYAEHPLSFAAGAEYRRYTASQRSDSLAKSGDLGGFGSAPPDINGAYHVVEGFAEVDLPIIENGLVQLLDVQAGVRQSHYTIETAGRPTFDATTYKVGANFSPIRDIKFRGNYQRAVRAPNIFELFAPVQTGLTNFTADPCVGAAPVNNANLRAVCSAQGAPANAIGLIARPSASQVNLTSGGNPNLAPEVSNSYTAGVVLQPNFVPRLTVTVDYYNIKVKKAITTPTPGDLIAACFGATPTAPSASAAASPACTVIRRDPTTGGLDGDTTTVPGLFGVLSNLGRLDTDGIDLTANYTQPLGFGKLNLSFQGNWTHRSRFQATPTSVNRECVRYYSVNCGSIQPRFSWLQRTTLTVEDVDFSLLWRHIGGVQQEPLDADPDQGNGPAFSGDPAGIPGTQTFNFGRIKAYNYLDLATRIGVRSNLDLTLTVSNLLDKDPPLTGASIGSTFFNSGNTYPSTYDPIGRRYAITARIKL